MEAVSLAAPSVEQSTVKSKGKRSTVKSKGKRKRKQYPYYPPADSVWGRLLSNSLRRVSEHGSKENLLFMRRIACVVSHVLLRLCM